MRLQKVTSLCYEFVDIGFHGTDRVLMSFFTPVVIRLVDGKTLVSKQALRRESSAKHIRDAITRWGVKTYEEVDGKDLERLVDPLSI